MADLLPPPKDADTVCSGRCCLSSSPHNMPKHTVCCMCSCLCRCCFCCCCPAQVKRWFHYDDSHVRPLNSIEAVRGACQRDGYLFFYVNDAIAED